MFQIVGKNLLKNTLVSKTLNALECVVNSDGSVVINGTATAKSTFDMIMTLGAGKYIFTCCPSGGTLSTYWSNIVNLSTGKEIGNDFGSGLTFELTEDAEIKVYISVIASGITANNLTFYPMIRLADDTDDTWQPYIDDVTPKVFNVEINGVTYPVERFDVDDNGTITTVWQSNTPFYWIQDGVVQDGYPSTYTVTAESPTGLYNRPNLTGFYAVTDTNYSITGTTEEVDTLRNKYMEIVVSVQCSNNGQVVVGDTTITTSGTYTIDVSNLNTVSIETTINGYATNDSSIDITSIRFYS